MIEEIERYNELIDFWLGIQYEHDRGLFLLLTIIAFVYLFMRRDKLRIKFLLPVSMIMFIVFSPILYKYVFSKIVYWRLFWMLPGAILMAAAIVELLKSMSKTWIKWSLLVVTILIIATQGQNTFYYAGFEQLSNWEKISQEAIDVSTIMLELDESPRAVVDSEIVTEIRQYEPRIELMFGREVFGGYIKEPSQTSAYVRYLLDQNPKEYYFALDQCRYYGYNFFVVKRSHPIVEQVSDFFGYYKVGETEEHIIYFNSEI